MPSYSKDNEAATNKLLRLLREKERTEDTTTFDPPEPLKPAADESVAEQPAVEQEAVSESAGETVSEQPAVDAPETPEESIADDKETKPLDLKLSDEPLLIDTPTSDLDISFEDDQEPEDSEPVDENVVSAPDKPDDELSVDFDSIVEEKFVESQDQIDRTTESETAESVTQDNDDDLPFSIDEDTGPELSAPAASTDAVPPGLSPAELIFQEFTGNSLPAEPTPEPASEPIESKEEAVAPEISADQLLENILADTGIDADIEDANDEPEAPATSDDGAEEELILETVEAEDVTEAEPDTPDEPETDDFDDELIFKDLDEPAPEEEQAEAEDTSEPAEEETDFGGDDLSFIPDEDDEESKPVVEEPASEESTTEAATADSDDEMDGLFGDLDMEFDDSQLPDSDKPAETTAEEPESDLTAEPEPAIDPDDSVVVEFQEDSETDLEEDFEDDLSEDDSQPVTFVYRKKRGFNLKSLIGKFQPSKGRVGLDIGTYAIKYINGTESGGITTINDFGYIKIPDDVKGSENELKKFTSDTLKEILSTRKNSKTKLNLLLNGHDIGIKSIHMPKVSKKELKDAVRWSTRKQLSFNADEATLDYKVISDLVEDGIPKLDILVVAAHNNLIEKNIELLSKTKIPSKITLVPLAAWHALTTHYPTENSDNVMVLDIGHSSTLINVINRGNLRFAREVGIAGRDFTDAIVGNLNTNTGEKIYIDEAQAEALKHTHGLPHGSQENIISAEGIPLAQISSRLRSPLERLANEIQRSMQYYAKEFPYGPIDKIYTCGGSSVMQNLDVFLSDYLNHDITVFSPMDVWESGEQLTDLELLTTNANSLVIPAGIALDNTPALNLLPEQLAQESQNVLLRFLLKSFVLIVVLAALSFSTITALRSSDKKSQLDELQGRLDQLSPRQKEYISYQDVEKDIKAKLNSLKSLSNKPTVDVEIFKIISNLIPQNITLDKLKVSDPENRPMKASVDCSGYLLSSSSVAKVALAEFILQLENSGYVSNINLRTSHTFNRNEKTGLYFEIEFEIVNDEN